MKKWMTQVVAACAAAVVLGSVSNAQTNHFVWLGGGHAAPYTNWATAATNIQAAITSSGTNDIIWVTNGLYNTGCGGLDVYDTIVLSNRVLINKPVTLQSVNGPQHTIIEGAYDPVATNGPAAVRCVYVTASGAKLNGFTLRNGATHTAGYGLWTMAGGGLRNGWVSNCWFIGNNARAYGAGAINATLFNCIVSGNTCTNGAGGGLYQCNVYSSTLANNTAHMGGGLALGRAHDCLIISNRVIPKSSNMGVGGGVFGEIGYVQYGGAIVSNCVIEANYGSWGSATYGGCTNYNCIIRGNHGDRSAVEGSGYDGFGIVGACHDCWIYSNSGGWESSAAMRTFLYNCVIYGNSDRGANYHAAVKNCKIYNCTIVGNISTNNKPAVRLETSSAIGPLMVNSIAWGNTGGNIYMTTGTVTYTCSPTLPGLAGEGCITNNPMFAAPGEGNWRLTRESPCLNKGLNMGWMTTPGEPGSSDLDGGPRVRHSTVDMGAYELRVPRGSTFSAE